VRAGASYFPTETEKERAESKRREHLNCLARLFTGKEVCVAICCHEGKLLVASNRREPKYAKEYMKKLQNFARNPSVVNYEELLKEAVEQTYNKLLIKSGRISRHLARPLEESEKKILREFRDMAKKVKSQQSNLSELQAVAEK